MIDIEGFIQESLQAWPMAQANYAELSNVESKTVDFGDGMDVRVQYNPKRMVSTGAKMDKRTLSERPCFLCSHNRPAEQKSMEWGDYEILVNPFPIFPKHLTIPVRKHAPQSLQGRAADMCQLAAALPGYVVFFNGAKSGASAPDHMHFQAGNADFLPKIDLCKLFRTIEITDADIIGAAERIEAELLKLDGDMLNVLCQYADGSIHATLIPRRAHRPSFYGDGPGQMIISPATVDLGGVFITPRRQDFENIDANTIKNIYKELCF